MSSQYPRDEFDIAGDDMPVGMHRPQPSRWKSVWPFIIILIVVPLIGWGASALLTHRTATQPQSATAQMSNVQTQPQSGAQSERQSVSKPEAQSTPAQRPQSEPQSVPKPEEHQSAQVGQVDYNAKISVLNGTQTAGLAARMSGILAEAGFPGTSAANAVDWVTEVSIVYYEDPQMKTTAEAVARALEIGPVAQTSGLGDPDVVVILR